MEANPPTEEVKVPAEEAKVPAEEVKSSGAATKSYPSELPAAQSLTDVVKSKWICNVRIKPFI